MAPAVPPAAPSARGTSRPAAAGGLTTPLLAIAAVTAVVSAVICYRLWTGSSSVSPDELLRMANRQFSLGNAEIAGELARRAIFPDDADSELVMQRHFLIGAGYAQQATDSAELAARLPNAHLALEHLRLAAANWPAGREDAGDRLLGQMLYHCGDFTRAAAPLQALVERNPSYRDALVPTLVRCLLRGGDERVEQGLRIVDEMLEARGKTPAIEQDLEHLRAECLTRLRRFQDAREQLAATLAKQAALGAEEAAAAELSTETTELLIAAADVYEAVERFGPGSMQEPKSRPEVQQFLEPAYRTLLRLQRDASPAVSLRTGRLLARAMLCAGNPADAISQLSAVRLRQPFEGEAFAASIEEIEHLVAQRSNREALQAARYMIAEIGSEASFDPSSIDLSSFRQRLQNVLTQLREQGETDTCIAIARSLTPIFSRDHAIYEEGLALRVAADKLVSARQQAGDDLQPDRSGAARALYAQAGSAFEEAARLRYQSPSYSETLWAAIEALQQSGQFSRSIELLSQYLQFEHRIRHPRALIAQGRAYLANAQPAAAIIPLMECVEEFPRDPLCYDARLMAARAMAELDQLDQAQALLNVNLTDGSLTPQSLTWKNSLLALAEVLWRNCHESHVNTELQSRQDRQRHPLEALRANQPKIEEAIARLRETMIRYWPDPQAMQAAATLAKANRLATVLPQVEAEVPDVLESSRRRFVRQRELFLQGALEAHRQIRKELARFEDERTLDLPEQLLLQTSLMGEADTLFELGEFEQSADAYRTISLRYMNEPPALEAMLGQARCLRALNRQREARLVIRQAVMVLGRIPPEWNDRFAQTTRYDRRRWEELLAWMDSGPLPQESGT